MLIRSQDKEELINMDRMAVIAIFDTYDAGSGAFGIFAFATDDMDYNDGCLLGRYTMKDKAKTVLSMIESQYVEVESPYTVTVNPPYPVFQMPQDEEVTEC